MDEAGVLTAFCVWVDGTIVGFASILMTTLPHYGAKVATVESLFVRKAYRSAGAGRDLMTVVESAAATNGCKAIFYSAPAGGQLEAVLGKRYARTNSIFCKHLG